jgi:hypothetical protein
VFEGAAAGLVDGEGGLVDGDGGLAEGEGGLAEDDAALAEGESGLAEGDTALGDGARAAVTVVEVVTARAIAPPEATWGPEVCWAVGDWMSTWRERRFWPGAWAM